MDYLEIIGTYQQSIRALMDRNMSLINENAQLRESLEIAKQVIRRFEEE